MSAEGEPPFHVSRVGERVEGLAAGIDRAHLRRLRRGEWEIDREVDLHGLDRRAARAALQEAVRSAHQARQRCLLVVHGRGAGSIAGPVLKPALPRWLSEPPTGPLVMAFASARPEHGGAGATYVLLRRRRD